MTRRLVVLPHPEGPRRLRNSPGSIARSTSSRPTMPPGNRFDSLSSRTTGSGAIAHLRGLDRVDPDDLAALLAGVAESMGKRALEGEAVTGLETVDDAVDGEVDLAAEH